MGVSWGTWWCVLNARLHREAGEGSPSREETLPPRGLLSVSPDLIRAPGLLDQGPPIQWAVTDFSSGAPKSLSMVTEAIKLEDACFLEGRL